MQHFNDFPSDKCGRCCQRTPCPLGLFLGELPMYACSKLVETNENEFECGLILNEKSELKKQLHLNLSPVVKVVLIKLDLAL